MVTTLHNTVIEIVFSYEEGFFKWVHLPMDDHLLLERDMDQFYSILGFFMQTLRNLVCKLSAWKWMEFY